MTTPLLFLGDSPSRAGGLSRILRDLATRAATLPQFRVGSLGRGGTYSRHLPFAQYSFPESAQWGEDYLQAAWLDFAGSERGIIFTVWDATRLSWLALPELLPACPLREWLLTKPFSLWGYFPVDAMAPSGGLSALGAEVVRSYDRTLAYSRFGASVVGKSLGREIDWAPHGLDLSIFKPQSRNEGRELLRSLSGHRFGLCDNDVLVGVVATNQARKDWGLVAATTALLRQSYGRRFKAWWHTDAMERSHAWNLYALLADFGLNHGEALVTTNELSDRQLAAAYSACNVTLAPGAEGFGYPSVESQACGIPVITGAGHGGTEFVTAVGGVIIAPIGERLEGIHNSVRYIHAPQKWAEAAIALIADERDQKAVSEPMAYLDWDLLGRGVWDKWMTAGLP